MFVSKQKVENHLKMASHQKMTSYTNPALFYLQQNKHEQQKQALYWQQLCGQQRRLNVPPKIKLMY